MPAFPTPPSPPRTLRDFGFNCKPSRHNLLLPGKSPPAHVILRMALLSPALSSRGGEGEDFEVCRFLGSRGLFRSVTESKAPSTRDERPPLPSPLLQRRRGRRLRSVPLSGVSWTFP